MAALPGAGRRERVAAVVVTYNRRELLLECLSCLRGQQLEGLSADFELGIIVIDNASTDGTAADLRALVDGGDIDYVNTGSNLGGAGGFSRGMREAVERGYDYVWVMDDDCMAHPDTLRELLVAAEGLSWDFGYLSSVCYWSDGTPCSMNRQRHPLHTTIENLAPDLQPCTLASFVSLFVPADVIAELGLPIADFFIWSDDWEFTRRVSRVYPCYVVGRSQVTHKCKTNGLGNVAIDSPERISRFRLAYRNDVFVYRREGLSGWRYIVVRDLWHLARILVQSRGNRLRRAEAVVGGTLEGLGFHPKIEYVARPK